MTLPGRDISNAPANDSFAVFFFLNRFGMKEGMSGGIQEGGKR